MSQRQRTREDRTWLLCAVGITNRIGQIVRTNSILHDVIDGKGGFFEALEEK